MLNNLNSANIQKDLWAAEVSYFAQNNNNLYDNTFTIKFYVRATDVKNATKIATWSWDGVTTSVLFGMPTSGTVSAQFFG